MFAIIKTGGKQYKVEKDYVLYVEKLEGNVGDTITLDNVLLFANDDKVEVGAPTVTDVKVQAEILDQKKSSKVLVFKKKRRQNYRRKNGHRQEMTVLKISDILKGAAKAAPKKAAESKTTTKKAETATPKKASTTATKKKTETKKSSAKKTD